MDLTSYVDTVRRELAVAAEAGGDEARALAERLTAPLEPPAPPPPPEPDDAATARINLRLPEPLKAGVEQAAARERLSVNAWLVRTIASALASDDPGRPRERRGRIGQSYTGWVR